MKPSTTSDPAVRTSDFELSSPDAYIQLSPIGLFPHSRGLQNVDPTAVATLVQNFKSFFARLGRRFAGLPFYVGHPDVAGFANTYTDRKAYGWIMDLQAREDGLYGRTKWSAAGRELIGHGHYKFLSPTWTVEKIGTDSGRPVYRPTQLISVGLTNDPNLPVLPLANSQTPEDLDTLLGLPLPLTPGLLDPLKPTAKPSDDFPVPPTPPEATPPVPPRVLENAGPLLLERMESLEKELSDSRAQLAQLQTHFITTLLNHAIVETRILPFERPRWQAELQANFETASLALANATPRISRHGQSDGLTPFRTAAVTFAEKQKRMLTLVNQRMHSTGLTYHQAWLETRADHPDLFTS